MKRILIIYTFIIFIANCGQLTPEQAFDRYFPNKSQPSVPLEILLKSPSSIEIDKVNLLLTAYIDDAIGKDNGTLKVFIYGNIPIDYKLDKIWFIYSVESPSSERIDKLHTSTNETDIFPSPKLALNAPKDSKYYEFNNINSSIGHVVIRIKKDSQVFYIQSGVGFPTIVT